MIDGSATAESGSRGAAPPVRWPGRGSEPDQLGLASNSAREMHRGLGYKSSQRPRLATGRRRAASVTNGQSHRMFCQYLSVSAAFSVATNLEEARKIYRDLPVKRDILLQRMLLSVGYGGPARVQARKL